MNKEKKNSAKDHIFEYSLVILGESRVGKTCLFRKIEIEEFEENKISTVGVSRHTFSDMRTYNKQVLFCLYDTASDPSQRGLIEPNIDNSDGALILYDITNKKSFDCVAKWINLINNNKKIKDKNTYTIFLMGNKSDLASEEEKREVSLNEAKSTYSKDKVEFVGEISTKYITVEDLKKKFEGFFDAIYNKRKNKKENPSKCCECCECCECCKCCKCF